MEMAAVNGTMRITSSSRLSPLSVTLLSKQLNYLFHLDMAIPCMGDYEHRSIWRRRNRYSGRGQAMGVVL
jgi:hypothetical protein